LAQSVVAKDCKLATKLQYPPYCFYIALSNTPRCLISFMDFKPNQMIISAKYNKQDLQPDRVGTRGINKNEQLYGKF
jgi:hypothetical protein